MTTLGPVNIPGAAAPVVQPVPFSQDNLLVHRLLQAQANQQYTFQPQQPQVQQRFTGPTRTGPTFPPQYNNPQGGQRSGGEVLGEMFKVYTTLKMGVLAYQAGKRAHDAGASTEESIKAGLTAAGAWMAFVMLSLFYPLWIGGVAIQVVKYYDPIHDGLGVQAISPLHLWTAVIGIGAPTLIFLVVTWLVLYSRLKNLIASPRAGWWYRRGVALNRGWFSRRSSVALYVMAVISLWPLGAFLTNLHDIFFL